MLLFLFCFSRKTGGVKVWNDYTVIYIFIGKSYTGTNCSLVQKHQAPQTFVGDLRVYCPTIRDNCGKLWPPWDWPQDRSRTRGTDEISHSRTAQGPGEGAFGAWSLMADQDRVGKLKTQTVMRQRQLATTLMKANHQPPDSVSLGIYKTINLCETFKISPDWKRKPPAGVTAPCAAPPSFHTSLSFPYPAPQAF